MSGVGDPATERRGPVSFTGQRDAVSAAGQYGGAGGAVSDLPRDALGAAKAEVGALARPAAVERASAALAQSRIVRTARLTLLPVGLENLDDLVRLKADPRVFEVMLHGVRTPERTREELEDDVDFWAVRGYGTWAVHLDGHAQRGSGEFLGIVGLMERPDGRGVALRYALWPECRGRGYAREAARAALDYAHAAGVRRVIGVARETNEASRGVMEEIGMTAAGEFRNQGHRMIVFESVR
ncbi:GNAT family N-acetyltransferase [Muricoccus radiodurans]|uniref:GNAT family N-acetyltransferase n=1 Tax=Muricoccus radiodurans TaxID=2231721 RepID=UPI003CF0C767